MDPTVVTVVVLVLVVLLVVALLAAAAKRRKEKERRDHLQERFGPEYDRAVADADDTRAAEARLARAEKRRETLDIRPLTPESRARRNEEWYDVQADFVTAPVAAVDSAHRLVREVMTERGYPSDDDDQRLSLLAADHADTVQHYRTAESHKARFDSGEGSTEDLRRAFVEYHQLFAVLVEEGADTMADPETRPGAMVDDRSDERPDLRSRGPVGDRTDDRDDEHGIRHGEHMAAPAGTDGGDDAPVGEHAGRHDVDLRDSRDPEPTPVRPDGATGARLRDDQD